MPGRLLLCPDCRKSPHLEISATQWRQRVQGINLAGMSPLQLQALWERTVLEHHDLRPSPEPSDSIRQTPPPQHIPAFDAPDAEQVIMGPEPVPMPIFTVEVDAGRMRCNPRAPRLLNRHEERLLLMQRGYAYWRGWQDIVDDRTERMVRYNLRMAMMTANKYMPTPDLAQLYSLCAQGIFWAVQDYDLSTSWKFSTFAMNKMRGAASAYQRGLESETLAAKQFTPIGKDKEKLYEVEDDRCDIGLAIEQEELRDMVLGWVNENLKPRDAEILLRRYGVVPTEDQTLQGIGDMVGLTRERVRQVLGNARAKLKKEIANRSKKSVDTAA